MAKYSYSFREIKPFNTCVWSHGYGLMNTFSASNYIDVVNEHEKLLEEPGEVESCGYLLKGQRTRLKNKLEGQNVSGYFCSSPFLFVMCESLKT